MDSMEGWELIYSGSSPIQPSFSSPTKPSSESWVAGEIINSSLFQRMRKTGGKNFIWCLQSSSEQWISYTQSFTSSIRPFLALNSGPTS